MENIPASQIIFSLLLTLAAGLATGVGSCIAFFFKRSDRKFLSFALGFSGGVMIYISLAELLSEARVGLIDIFGKRPGALAAIAAFFGGIFLAMLIDKLVPSHENPHEVRSVEEMDSPRHRDKILRSGTLFALAVGIHNFPEGMAVFVSSLANPGMGLSIAAAIAIHNIPEGIAVAIPIYYATKSKGKALLYATLSGFSEVIGALLCLAVTAIFGLELTGEGMAFPLIMAAVAGIMIYISLDELLPTAEKYGKHHIAIAGVVGGMAIMGISLLLM